jgi:hypothetical protein
MLIDFRLGGTMDDLFSLWDNLLKQLAFHQGPFLALLTKELVKKIISPSLTEPKLDRFREAATLWLLQICVSKEWSVARKRGKLGVDALLSTCLQNPNHWTNYIATMIVHDADHQRAKEIYGDRIAVAVMEEAAAEDLETRRISAANLEDQPASHRVRLEATGVLGERANDRDNSALSVGGWGKWRGQWTSKPFGMI